MSAVHHSWRWQKVRQVRLDAAIRAAEPCYRCGAPIDYTLSGRHAHGPQVDHLHPAALRPDLAYEITNLAVSHRACNQKHGARLGGLAVNGLLHTATTPVAPKPPYTPSRVW
jgi:5-methylcytosine-specific restriction endonuclease McrA